MIRPSTRRRPTALRLSETDRKYVLAMSFSTFLALAVSVYSYQYSLSGTKLRHGISIDAMTSAGLVLLGGAIQRQFLPTERFTNRKEVASERFTRPDSYMAIGAVLDAVAMLAKFVAFEKLSAERCIALLLPVEGLYRAYRGGFCSRQTSTAITLVLAVALGILADFSNASTETHTIADNFTGYIALLCSIAATGCSMQQIRPEPHEYSFLGGAVLLASALCAYMFGVSQWSGNLVLEVIAILAGICACSWSATQPRAISTSLRISWPLVVTLTAFLSLNLLHTMNVSQAFSLALLYIALYRSVQTSGVASSAQSAANVIPSNLVSSKFGGYYINEILREKESRDIFYFLLLNLSFMVIQMLYGIWTNSLGLISDSIHMFFDCLALAVGLVAAVMSKWPASRSHPFGFAKVEIISGFANGIFLVLISFSIMIEAIERLMEPPEMTTDQLLLISTLGLGVNLVGIFAFNHGHHHGHSHGHSHSHGHGHDHETSPAPLPTIHTPRVDRHGGFADNIPGLRSPLVPNFSDFSGFDNSPEIVSDASPSNTDLREVNSNSLSAPEILSSNRTPVRSRSPIRRPGSPLKTAHEPVLADVAEQTELSSIKKENRVNLDDSHARHHDHNAEHDHLHNHNHECDHDHGHTHGHTHSKSLLSPINLHARSPSYDVRSDLVPSSKPPPHSQHHHHHGHDHSHNMEGIFLHILADTLGSAGVIVSTLLIRISGWTGFDPLASIFIAVLIFLSVIPLLKSSFRDLLLTLQNDQEYTLREVLGEVSLISGVGGIPFIRFWIDGEQNMHGILTIRAGIDGDTDVVRQKVKRKLHEGVPDLVDVIVQVDRSD